MGYARNLKFGMVVTTNKRCEEFMLNKHWLPLLSCGIKIILLLMGAEKGSNNNSRGHFFIQK